MANMDEKLWYKSAIFYEIYIRAFADSNADGHGDLRGATERLDYLKDLGVDCVWLMPIYPSPLKDDGYDISNYYDVYPAYGTLHDVQEFIEAAHARGIRVILDLVLNHTSDQHPWFQAARSDPNSPYRDYYVWSKTDDRYPDARIIFLDTERSNWAWDEAAQMYYWHRFYSSQPDLNYDNPAVRQEMFNVMQFWLELGVDGFRSDAVPYLFEREGTNCENLPVTHAYLKEIRAFINQHYPDRILLAEANQWPRDVIHYFGEGDDEFHMGFHFPLMPRIFMALRKEDRTPLVWILSETPPLTESTQWCIFLRNHDELTLEMVTEEERQWMWNQFAPDPRMRLNLGIRRRLAPLLDNDPLKLGLAYSLLFTMPGSPIIYYGDEIGMGDNIWLPDRNGVRTPMQWDTSLNGGFSQADPADLYLPVVNDPVYGPEGVNVASQRSDPGSLFNRVRHMIAVRKTHPAFGWGDFSWVFGAVPADSLAVAAYLRCFGDERLLVVNNLSGAPHTVTLQLPEVRSSSPVDLLTGQTLPPIEYYHMTLTLEPYQFLWLQI
jgi:maltose alpha-D-glucosyltransferase / alpha-amylase